MALGYSQQLKFPATRPRENASRLEVQVTGLSPPCPADFLGLFWSLFLCWPWGILHTPCPHHAPGWETQELTQMFTHGTPHPRLGEFPLPGESCMLVHWYRGAPGCQGNTGVSSSSARVAGRLLPSSAVHPQAPPPACLLTSLGDS